MGGQSSRIDVTPLHVSHSDFQGGAARAAYRIHTALRAAGVDSSMRVAVRLSDDWTVRGPRSRLEKAWTRVSFYTGRAATTLSRPADGEGLRTLALLPTGLGRELNRSAASLLHLHWIGHGMLSVGEIGALQKPVVWTLHDMWAFCGAEHLVADEAQARFRNGYRSDNRRAGESGFDLNRWVWERKRRCWKGPMTIVCPSQWLAQCAKDSALLREQRIETIPIPIDTTAWRPVDRGISRDILGVARDSRIVLFGAIGGTQEFHKGGDLLFSALQSLPPVANRTTEVLVFGQTRPKDPPRLPFPVRYLGMFNDDVSLRLVYSAADVLVVPSRQESFGQTASEAQACGVPVVAFNVGGLRDIIDDRITGYLAQPFDPQDFARGISWVLEDDSRRAALGASARAKVETRFSSPVVSRQYLSLYEDILRDVNRRS